MISDYNKQTNRSEKFYRFDRPSKTLVELAEGEDRFLKYSETVTDYYKGTDMTIPLSISYESEDVILDLRYNIGLNNISKEVEKMRNNVITFSIGYRIPLLGN